MGGAVEASDDTSGEITALEEMTEWRDATIGDAATRFYRATVIP